MFEEVEKQLLSLLKRSVAAVCSVSSAGHQVPQQILDAAILEIPKDKSFGDLSCSIAMKLSSFLRTKPQAVAAAIVEELERLAREEGATLIQHTEIKGAGFINIFLSDRVYQDLLRSINEEKEGFGMTDAGGRGRLLLEFVSANPTGALSIAHARQAAVGDALANVLGAVGYEVTREYYLNDEGNQIRILGRSIWLRYCEKKGETIDFPEDHYQGDYIGDLAAELLNDPAMRGKIDGMSEEARDSFFMEYGTQKIMAVIRKELDDFGVSFDVWYSQKALGASGKVEEALEELKAKGYIYESEGAVWFKSTAFGDDKDRVVRKSDGAYTYLTPDIAYHKDKFQRGFAHLVNIWGRTITVTSLA